MQTSPHLFPFVGGRSAVLAQQQVQPSQPCMPLQPWQHLNRQPLHHTFKPPQQLHRGRLLLGQQPPQLLLLLLLFVTLLCITLLLL
jgi:hypothetical protein